MVGCETGIIDAGKDETVVGTAPGVVVGTVGIDGAVTGVVGVAAAVAVKMVGAIGVVDGAPESTFEEVKGVAPR